MKANDWKFDKYLPDVEDIEAQCNAAEAFFELVGLETDEVHSFGAGFNRGIAWANDKIDVKKLQSLLEKLKITLIAVSGDEQVNGEIDQCLVNLRGKT